MYLTKNLDSKYHTTLAKFGLYSNNLAIETCRYTNKDRQQRACTQYNMGMIEDLYRLLLVCTKYRELRHTFLKAYYCKWPSMQCIIVIKFQNNN